MLSLLDALDALEAELPRIAMPSLVITSRQDHVVPPASSEYFLERVAGPVEHVWLEASYHVATLDYDAAEIERRAVAFAQRTTEPIHS
jgi:carboxylesterase